MICFGYIGVTTVVAVTDAASPAYTADDSAGDAKRFRLLVSSDKAIHLQRNGDAAPTSAPRVPAETIIEVMMFGGDTLSVILASGETDGSVWITLAE